MQGVQGVGLRVRQDVEEINLEEMVAAQGGRDNVGWPGVPDSRNTEGQRGDKAKRKVMTWSSNISPPLRRTQEPESKSLNFTMPLKVKGKRNGAGQVGAESGIVE